MILKLENINYTVSDRKLFSAGKEIKILNNINLSIERGDITGITGESGSGKTTLAKIVAGILKQSSGKIHFNPREKMPSKISPVQILFQNNGYIINPFRRGIDYITETLSKRYGNASTEKIEEITDSLGISIELLKRRGMELSGGEQQRIALARILAAGPELMILDEPFSAQDPESQVNLISLFSKINKEYNITLICISHYTHMLKLLCNNLIVMYNGSIAESGKAPEIFDNPLHPYTKFLFSAESYKLTAGQLQNRFH